MTKYQGQSDGEQHENPFLAVPQAAWADRDHAALVDACVQALGDAEAAPQVRSYAHLRLVQSQLAVGDTDAAVRELEAIEAAADYPEVHRWEAGDIRRELARQARGQAPRDPLASRTQLPDIGPLAAEVHVAPHGDDQGDGTSGAPFASLTRARDAVRALRRKGVTGAAAVTLAPGEYRVTGTFELTSQDSAAPGAPVVYRSAVPGAAVLYGGERLAGFAPVTDPDVLARLPEESRQHVLQCNLKAQGITDYGTLRVRGYGQKPSPPALELMFNGEPQTIARWPNAGFVQAGELVDPGSPVDGRPAVLRYQDERHARWTKAEDAWLFGYFRYLWADASIPVGRIDPAARTLTTGEPYGWRDQGMSPDQGIIYYAYNLLEELDQPGEWYLDRRSGMLYLYPPSEPATATIEIGVLSVPMMTMEAVSDVRVEGLTLDLARYNGIEMRNCSRCVVAGCTVARMAGNGILIQGGEENGVLGCDIHTIGRRATEVIGGDRATLTPGRHFVENCCIHGFGRIDRTYTPAIQLEGVGHRVAHNLMYDGPSSAMRIEGNDHLIEYNDVHSVVRESDDQGGMELFMNPTYRGVIFRYNRFRNVGKTGTETAVHGQAAIRLDDAISGIQLYGNLFIRSANGKFGAVQMNSGRDNVIDNNLFIDCRQGISGGWRPGNIVWQGLRQGEPREGFYLTELYLARYPRLAHLLDEPAVNHIWRNMFYRCGEMVTGDVEHLDLLANVEYVEGDPGFVDADGGDFHLHGDAPVLAAVAFRPLPVAEMGLYQDAYRASWPVQTEPVPMPDWRT